MTKLGEPSDKQFIKNGTKRGSEHDKAQQAGQNDTHHYVGLFSFPLSVLSCSGDGKRALAAIEVFFHKDSTPQ